MRAELVVNTINLINGAIPKAIFHSDQGSQYGAEVTRVALLTKGFLRSMSRAGTPTDNGYARAGLSGNSSSPLQSEGGMKHSECFFKHQKTGSISIMRSVLMRDEMIFHQISTRRLMDFLVLGKYG